MVFTFHDRTEYIDQIPVCREVISSEKGREKLQYARHSTGRRGSDNIPKPLITLCKQLAQAITSIHIAIKHTQTESTK